MRKFAIFSVIISILLGLFTSIQSAFAQGFNYAGSNSNTTPQIQYCNNGSCTIESGSNAVKKQLGKENITDKPISVYAQNVVAYFLGFISIIGVIYIIWAGFRIMTSNGDEEVVTTSKKTVMFVALGIIVMWLAYSLVNFLITFLDKTQRTSHTNQHSTHIAWNLIPQAHAQAYTESEAGTFGEYKYRVQVAAEELEAELKINKRVSAGSIAKLKSLVQQAFDRLPDKNTEASRTNESNKRYADLKLDLALKEPDSHQIVGEAITQVVTFVNSAKIEQIQGNISATPTAGNAPLVTSFLAQGVIDPSGTIPPNGNYIWWIRENGGRRKEIGKGPSLTYDFKEEGNYTVNLDVLSASRNSKGKTDVLPLSTSVNIQVQPKLGEITLLINGVNVSNMHEMKISPAIAAQGLIFDASASRAIGNGRILETTWDFDNGNTRQYKSAPGAERQVFATSGEFHVTLSFKTNDGQTFSKEITLKIKDPAASIKTEKLTGHAGDTLSFVAETFFGNIRNVEYTWTVQNENGKRDTQSGTANFNYTFKEIGSYTVTLQTRSPNGDIDNDSKTIKIESHDPIATLDTPRVISNERPNTFIFDASRSYDLDTNSRQELTYEWKINGESVTLDPLPASNDKNNNSKGTYTFDTTGENTVSVLVTNKYGKIATAEQTFTVQSTLAGNLIITPQVVKVGDPVTLAAHAPNARFFTWNMGDSSPVKSGNNASIQHIYKATGTYNVTLTLQGENQNESTTISRRVYVTDMDSPLAIIKFSNSSNNIILEPGACNGKDAYLLTRGEITNLMANDSINVDGNASNLDYTWRFMGKVSTLASINETFRDLGCFPVSLTVKSKTNGASHTTTEYIKLNNQPPQLTNISTVVDSSKKDSQKIIVKATANGVSDADGVITSYIWYYTTASDNEPQGLQITQKPEMTFVLPNVTEQYYFGVIIEDNNGARIDSRQYLQNQAPLIIDNENSNLNLPLISLNVPNKVIKVGQPVTFSAEAKTITGINVTAKSQYAWDFDGDGRIDEKTNTPNITHTFTRAGDYTLRVRVTHNGISNTKYHTIHVRNELKAQAMIYRLPNGQLYLLNTSQGVYDKTLWKVGDISSDQLESLILEEDQIPMTGEGGKIGTLKVIHNDSDFSETDILVQKLEFIEPSENGEIIYQSYPKAENDVITILDPSEVLKISFYGNKATNYAIDTDLDMDGVGDNMDGTPDNDIDNRESASYTNGSLFTISDFSHAKNRERKMKITLYDGTTPIKNKIITLRLAFIPETKNDDFTFFNLSEGELTSFEKERLETLSSMIRSLEDADRIILMQKYNVLAENWMSTFEKSKNLVDLQLLINERPNIKNKDEFSKIIDELLISDADTSNAVHVAATLVRNLLPPNSPNYQQMKEKIEAIASNPSDRETNKRLGEELLVLIQTDPELQDEYKILIKQQLQLILNHGDASKVDINTTAKNTGSSQESGGVTGFFGSILTIVLGIFGVIIVIGIILFIVYKVKSTDENMGFQDFIIDQFANKEKTETSQETTTITEKSVKTQIEPEKNTSEEDSLKTYTPPNTETDPLHGEVTENIPSTTENTATMPDWLTPQTDEMNTTTANAPTDVLSDNSENNTSGGLPDWLSPGGEEGNEALNEQTFNVNEVNEENIPTSSSENTGGLPDWLTPQENVSEMPSENTEIQNSDTHETHLTDSTIAVNTENTGELPDWLSPNEPGNGGDNAMGEFQEGAHSEPLVPVGSNNENSTHTSNEITGAFEENTSTEIPSGTNEETNNEAFDSTFSYTMKKTLHPEPLHNDSYTEITGQETQTEAELPNWLQSITETHDNPEVTSQENLDDNTNIPETSSEIPLESNTTDTKNIPMTDSDSPIQDISNTNNNSETASLPDWLQETINNTNQETTLDTINNNTTNSISNESQDNNFPDWLVDSAHTDNVENATKNSLIEADIQETTTPKVDTTPYEETNQDIPEWLMGDAQAKNASNTPQSNTSKTLEESFEEKITQDLQAKQKAQEEKQAKKNTDESIPEWLK